jgi:two-component system chemotaxis sensor kinase CheA
VVGISVSDSGIGIDTEQQQRIFEAFAQGDGSTARLYGGTGLGLSISRELVGLLGGELTVTSTPGHGSTFTVYLPVGSPATGMRPAALTAPVLTAKPAGSIEGAVFDGLKILLVDDDFRNIFALTALLERGHAEVTMAESGSDAIAILERKRDIDIVLMDIMMPVMDGYDTIRAIRRFEHFNSLPIIAVTGKVVEGERRRCIDAGANDYVPKPVDTAELIAALGPWLPTATPTAA